MKSPGVAICSYGNIQEDFSRFFLYTELGRSKLNFAILYVVQTFRHHLYRGDVFFKVIFHDLFVYTWFKRSDFKTFFPLYSILGQNECWRSLHLLFRTHRCYFCQVFFNERSLRNRRILITWCQLSRCGYKTLETRPMRGSCFQSKLWKLHWASLTEFQKSVCER